MDGVLATVIITGIVCLTIICLSLIGWAKTRRMSIYGGKPKGEG